MSKPYIAEIRRARGMGLPDTLIVLAVSCTIVLFLLWLAVQALGRPGVFEQFPPWLKDLLADWKTFVGGAGASSVAAALKYFTDRDTQHPNYLLWIGGTSLALMGLLVVTTRLVLPSVPDGSGSRPQDAKLILRFGVDAGSTRSLLLNQIEPLSYENPRRLALQPQLWFKDLIGLPQPGQTFKAVIVRETTESALGGVNHPASEAPPTQLCLVGKTAAPSAVTPDISLACEFGGHCTPSPNERWVGSCPRAAGLRWSPLRSEAFAQPAAPVERVWRVPSLETLEALRDKRDGVGYTKFTLSSGALPQLQRAAFFTYAIRVNGIPVFVNGFPPESLRVAFNPAKGLALAFGLENLNFKGARAGEDEVAVTLDFRHAQASVKTLRVVMPYVALRSSPERTTVVDGVAVRWSAAYVPSARENKYEVFIYSTRDPKQAEHHRQAVDDTGVRSGGRLVVGVIRPPLDKNPHYGVVLGLVQETGQVRFTFEETTANALCGVAVGLPQTARSSNRADLYRYDVDKRQARPCG